MPVFTESIRSEPYPKTRLERFRKRIRPDCGMGSLTLGGTTRQILLKADADGPAWTDSRIAEAFGCRRQTVEMLRQRLVETGFQETLDGKKRADPPTPKLLDGEQEAKIIATRLGPPPKGYANWTLRLLARKVVELQIVDAVSYETVRRTLKKTA